MQQFSCVLHEQSTGHLSQHGTPSLKSYRDQISLYKKKKGNDQKIILGNLRNCTR